MLQRITSMPPHAVSRLTTKHTDINRAVYRPERPGGREVVITASRWALRTCFVHEARQEDRVPGGQLLLTTYR